MGGASMNYSGPKEDAIYAKPGKLWSLWDMQRFYADRLSSVWASLASNQSALSSKTKLDEADLMTSAFQSAVTETMLHIKRELRIMGLLSASHQVERIEEQLKWIGKTYKGVPTRVKPELLAQMFDELGHRIIDELKGRFIFLMSGEEAELFEPPAPVFGMDVAGRFSTIAYDAEEASKCRALERSTASAFHSIRCLEAGIRALSRCLQIPDPTRASERNWGMMLKKIKDEIDRRWPSASCRISGDGEFFDNAYAALAAMQNPWRNATMHLDQKYTPDEAKHIFEIVCGFMKVLAFRMDEDGLPLA
jgi:hypothetical protein